MAELAEPCGPRPRSRNLPPPLPLLSRLGAAAGRARKRGASAAGRASGANGGAGARRLDLFPRPGDLRLAGCLGAAARPSARGGRLPSAPRAASERNGGRRPTTRFLFPQRRLNPIFLPVGFVAGTRAPTPYGGEPLGVRTPATCPKFLFVHSWRGGGAQLPSWCTDTAMLCKPVGLSLGTGMSRTR